jgi:hypothetical protein
MRNRLPKNMGDLLAGLFVVLFIGTATLSAMVASREADQRVQCAKNLHQIGVTIVLYQTDNQQWYPRTTVDQTGDPKPVWGTPYESDKKLGPVANASWFGTGREVPAANDVTAAFFLLISKEQADRAIFECPAAKLKAWDLGGANHGAGDWTNWPGNDGLAHYLSYSYQNFYPKNDAIAAGFQNKNPDATFAIASDMNPGSDAVTKVTTDSTADELKTANSLNHNRAGQNVLYGDGHIEWQTTVFCGTQHDNIFTAGGPEIKSDPAEVRKTAKIATSPVDSLDSILLPTAADIGFNNQPAEK